MNSQHSNLKHKKNGSIQKNHSLIQKLKKNNLSFLIDKLNLNTLSDSLSSKRKKVMEKARSILDAKQLQTFKSIINDVSSTPMKAPTIPPKPPKPSEPTPETIISNPIINALSPVTTLPLPPISMSTSSSPNNNHNETTNIFKNVSITSRNVINPHSPPPPLMPQNSNSHSNNSTIKPQMCNHTNNKQQQNDLNIPQIASTSNIPSLSAILFKDMVQSSGTPEILLQNALKTISDAYTKQIVKTHNEFKEQHKATVLSIKQIDDRLNLLSLQKKELNLYMSNYTMNMNHQLNELESHKEYISAVHSKYKIAVQNSFTGGNDLIDNQDNNLICTHCGHLSNDYIELNDHLKAHKDDIPKLSANEWKTALLDVIGCYQAQLEAFTAPQMLQKAMFPPKQNENISATLNVMGGMRPNAVTNGNHNHNHNIRPHPLPIPSFDNTTFTDNTKQHKANRNIRILGANIDDTNWINTNSTMSKPPEIVDITDNPERKMESDDGNASHKHKNGSVNKKKRKRMIASNNQQLQRKKRKSIPTLIDITNDNDDIEIERIAMNNYPKYLDLEFVLEFHDNQLIDYRDFNARYLQAKIMQIEWDHDQNHSKFGIHYIGWDNKWNVWSVPKYQYRRYAMYGNVSRRGLHRKCMRYVSLKKPWGDYLEVRALHLHEHTLFKLHHQPNDMNVDRNYVDKYLRWCVAQVVQSDAYSAQVQAVLLIQNQYGEWYKPQPKADLYWVHLDNEQECVPCNTYIINPKIRQTAKKRRII